MMPRPMLVDNFNLTYRKIPVLAIGKDLIVDTSLIVEWLHTDPRLQAFRANKKGHEVHHDARGRALARILSSHYTDRPLFRLTTGLIPGAVWRTSFGTDRADLIGHNLDADKLEKKLPRNIVGLDTYLSILEPMFAGREGWVLEGPEPSAADVALFYQLDWGEKIGRGVGIYNLTGGGTGDGGGEGMAEVFNGRRCPGLWAWFQRFGNYIEGLPLLEKRIETGDQQGVNELMGQLEEVDGTTAGRLMPTPNQRLEGLEARIGLRIGAKVSIAPDDTGRNDPTVGKLFATSPEEVVVEPDPPTAVGKKGTKARVDGIKLHFPRVGFTVVPVDEAKL